MASPRTKEEKEKVYALQKAYSEALYKVKKLREKLKELDIFVD